MKHLLGWALALLGPALVAHSAVLSVPAEHESIQQALDASAVGDTVRVAPGVYQENILAPAHAFTLQSHYPLSRDSSDWHETILDGGGLGSVITIESTQGGWTRIQGLVIRNGNGGDQAGGIHCDCPFSESENNLELSSLIFSAHQTTTALSTDAYIDGYVENLVLRNTIFDNTTNQPRRRFWAGLPNARVDSVRFLGNGLQGAPGGISAGSLFVADVLVRDYTMSEANSRFGLSSSVMGDLRRIQIEGNETPHTSIAQMGSSRDSGGIIRIRDVLFRENVHHHVPDLTSSQSSLSISGDRIDIDSLVVEENYSANSQILGIETHGDTTLFCGSVNHLIVRNNQSGDSVLYEQDSGQIAKIVGCNIRNSLFTGNRSELPFTSPGNSEATWGGSLYLGHARHRDTLYIENTEFSHNRLTDRDDYSQVSGEYMVANFGHAIYLRVEGEANVVMRNCVAHNNQLVNPCPEIDFWWSLGGTVYAFMNGDSTSIRIEDCSFTENQDGALHASGSGQVLIRNCALRDNERFGIYSAAGLSDIRNVWISGTTQVDVQTEIVPSRQVPLLQEAAIQVLRNLSITQNQTTSLLRLNPQSWSQSIVENILVWDNNYEELQAVFGNPDQEQPALFRYSLLSEEVEFGEENLIGVDPLFHEELGFPFLSASSPCIDAGCPDSLYNDSADPENPGLALWPSQGALRNDIGFTGGPYAGTLEHLVRVQPGPEESGPLPTTVQLLRNYPNPFNAQSRLEYVLPTEGSVSIQLFDIRGRMLKQLYTGFQGAGLQQMTLQGDGLSSGVYFVKVESRGTAQVEKVLLVK